MTTPDRPVPASARQLLDSAHALTAQLTADCEHSTPADLPASLATLDVLARVTTETATQAALITQGLRQHCAPEAAGIPMTVIAAREVMPALSHAARHLSFMPEMAGYVDIRPARDNTDTHLRGHLAVQALLAEAGDDHRAVRTLLTTADPHQLHALESNLEGLLNAVRTQIRRQENPRVP